MLDPARFNLNEFSNQIWVLTVEEGTTIEDVMKPEFLANVSSRLRPYDTIRVRVDSGEWYAELLVVTCGRVWAKTVKMLYLDLSDRSIDEIESEAYDLFFIKHKGPHLGYCVIRKSDKEVIKDKLDNKAMAQTWLANHLLTM